MIVDAHQHLWQIGRNGHEWPTPDLPAIHRDFVTADLEAVASACGVTATVLVQSQPSALDTDWMLAVAAQ
ncbi:MAG: amidohydrolase, partial [Asticcacaulis sp.]|nr:amidohydrolase [Asticcacaulis sp.]